MGDIRRTVCPLDCYAHCGLLVVMEGERAIGVRGDPDHPLTGGLVCGKAGRHLERLYSPQRVLHPMRRTNGGWSPISWDEAYDLIATQLVTIRDQWGPAAVLHLSGGGTEGLLKELRHRFFNAFGGVTVPEGSTCWGSGYAAQECDFGAVYAHDWADHRNARSIFLWGRDPATTNIHLLPHLEAARQNGAVLVVVNPVRTRSADLANLHLAPRPGTDGALALGMANAIIDRGLVDRGFIREHVRGFEEYAALVRDYPPEAVAGITDVPSEAIREAALIYARNRPSAIIFGYGMQRYANGGQTVRAIDALAAITGNIGIPGGGASYANQYWRGLFADLKSEGLDPQGAGALPGRPPGPRRLLPYPALAQAIVAADDPPVRAIFITGCNPVTQLPDSLRVREAFSRAGFVVVIDYFLNDTADVADLFLPCTTFLEEEDLVFNSWNPYLAHAPRIVESLGEARSELQIFTDLAERLELRAFGRRTAGEWLERALAPASRYGITLDAVRAGPVRNPLARDVAWEDHRFSTPSGKYELWSERAAALGRNPLPAYVEPAESPRRHPGLAAHYPLHLLTSHHRDYMHSQFTNLGRGGEGPAPLPVDIHPDSAAARGIADGDRVRVESLRGELEGVAHLTDRVRPDVVQIRQGGWLKQNACVNTLTGEHIPDLGLGIPYYDCLCEVKKV